MRWWRRRAQQHPNGEDARAAHETAEQQLAEAQDRQREVSQLAARIRRLPRDELAAAIEAAMHRRPA